MSAQCRSCLVWFDASMLNARGTCARCRSRGTWCLALLLVACGGSAESPGHEPTDVYQPRSWCCEMPGIDAVECGHARKSAPVCYCDGVVNGDECEAP